MLSTVSSPAITPVAVPDRLQHLFDPPAKLFSRGDGLKGALSQPCLAVVGSRKASPYGQQVTRQLAGQAASRGITIISGLAFGIDAWAHQAALDAGGRTIAVMAGGLDVIYPRSHEGLARQVIASGGCLLSEYPAGTPALKHQFVARNRLIAGLADGVLITEAAAKSGSLHTADFALQLGRKVFAVPGNITQPGSAGTNRLIRDGAAPVSGIGDLLEGLGVANASTTPGAAKQHPLVQLVSQGVHDGDALLQASRLPLGEFQHQLTMLELSGQLRPAGANSWTIG